MYEREGAAVTTAELILVSSSWQVGCMVSVRVCPIDSNGWPLAVH